MLPGALRGRCEHFTGSQVGLVVPRVNPCSWPLQLQATPTTPLLPCCAVLPARRRHHLSFLQGRRGLGTPGSSCSHIWEHCVQSGRTRSWELFKGCAGVLKSVAGIGKGYNGVPAHYTPQHFRAVQNGCPSAGHSLAAHGGRQVARSTAGHRGTPSSSEKISEHSYI